MLGSLKRRFSKVIKKLDTNLSAVTKRQHYGVHCDSCDSRNIIGDRFACTICSNYNLCSECFCAKLKSKKHESNHPCLLITHPEHDAKASHKLELIHENFKNKDFNITCDLCDTKVYGVYIKCNVCYCTFMCLKCYKEHDKTHNLILYNTVRLEKFQLEDLKLENMLDNGNFGFVYDAVLKPYKYRVAVKLMNKKIYNKLSFKKFDFTPKEKNMEEKFLCVDKELEAYIEIFSPFIVKLLGYGRDHTQRLFLVMEFMTNGSLEDFMINSKKDAYEIPLFLKLKIMLNIASGITDIHAKNFIHADIKPKNILLDSKYMAKICDLGSMKNFNFNTYDNNTGGLYYLPAEFFYGKYDNKIDIYSFGLILYHLFSGHRHSYTNENQLIINKLGKIPLYFLKNLVLLATSGNPLERKTIVYYKNILQMYVLLMKDILDKYSLEDSNQLDMIIICLNDLVLEYINNKFDIKLEINCTGINLEMILDEKVKRNLTKAVFHLQDMISKCENKKQNIESATRDTFF